MTKLSSRIVRLTNSSGVTAFVTIQRHIPSGHTFSFPLGPFGSWNYPLPDPYHSAVTVDVISGYIFGQRWDSRKTPDTSLTAKCKQIEEEQAAKEKAKIEEIQKSLAFLFGIGGGYGRVDISRYLPSSSDYLSSIDVWINSLGFGGGREAFTYAATFPPGTPLGKIRPCQSVPGDGNILSPELA